MSDKLRANFKITLAEGKRSNSRNEKLRKLLKHIDIVESSSCIYQLLTGAFYSIDNKDIKLH
jgi:hypothetical protein